MKYVQKTAVQLGIDHRYIPPHQQSLNEAEKVCESTFSEVRAVMIHHNVPQRWFGLMVDFAMHTDIRTATIASRDWKTPYELTRGVMPFIGKIHRPRTRCFVQVPKSKRLALAKKGTHNLRAEPGRLVGYQGPYSSTYVVMLDLTGKRCGERDRLVHSRNVSFNDNDFIMPPPAVQRAPATAQVELQATTATPEEAERTKSNKTGATEVDDTERVNEYRPVPNRNENFDEYFDKGDPANHPWFTHASPPREGPRPSYNKMCAVMKEQAMVGTITTHSSERMSTYADCLRVLNTVTPRHEVHTRCARILAAHSQSDMDWSKAFAGPDRNKAIQALENEIESLKSTILTEISPQDEGFDTAINLVTPGGLLLAIKRSGAYNAR
jgi:hypothetical protein